MISDKLEILLLGFSEKTYLPGRLADCHSGGRLPIAAPDFFRILHACLTKPKAPHWVTFLVPGDEIQQHAEQQLDLLLPDAVNYALGAYGCFRCLPVNEGPNRTQTGTEFFYDLMANKEYVPPLCHGVFDRVCAAQAADVCQTLKVGERYPQEAYLIFRFTLWAMMGVRLGFIHVSNAPFATREHRLIHENRRPVLEEWKRSFCRLFLGHHTQPV